MKQRRGPTGGVGLVHLHEPPPRQQTKSAARQHIAGLSRHLPAPRDDRLIPDADRAGGGHGAATPVSMAPAHAEIANRNPRQLVSLSAFEGLRPAEGAGVERPRRARESSARPASRPAACAWACAPMAAAACCTPASVCIARASDACKRATVRLASGGPHEARPQRLDLGGPLLQRRARITAAKKPWAVACFATICVRCAGTLSLHQRRLRKWRSRTRATERYTIACACRLPNRSDHLLPDIAPKE